MYHKLEEWKRKKIKSGMTCLIQSVSCIPDSEKVIVAGDLDGHIDQERHGYEAVHGG